MDKAVPEVEKSLESQLAQFGQRQGAKSGPSISDALESQRFTQSDSPLTEVREALGARE